MLKNCLFVILVLLMKPVFAASIMSHEKFVHLSYEEQKKVVIATMELIVEIEEKYKHQVKTSGFDPERFRRYTEFMKKVSNLLFFPEAHAVERNVRYGQYLNQLRTILNQRDRCIYGGWASEMVGNLCIHPRNSRFSNIYFADNGCSGIGNISCNPAIFGFKNVAQKSLFCVPAGRAGSASDNTSRECMNKALYSNEAGASSREDRIQNMIAGIATNPLDANAVFDFLLRACACDSRSPEISQHYQAYMRPHRTCFSMLKMMSEVMPQCTVNPSLMDTNQLSFLEHLKTTVSEAEIKSSNPNTIDAVYRAAVVGNGSADSGFVSRADYRAICGGNPPVPVTTCDDQLKLSTGVCCDLPQRPNADRSDCVDVGGPIIVNGGTVDCRPPRVLNPAGACVDGPAGGGGDPTPTTCPNGATNPPTCTCSTTEEILNNRCVAKCPTGVNRAADGSCPAAPVATCANGATNHPECTTCSTTQEMIGGSCVEKCIEGTGPRNPTTKECSQTCTDPKKEIKDKACVEKCDEGEIRNDRGVCGAAPAPHKIEVKSTIKDLNSATITGKVNGGTTIIPDHTVIWFSKGTNIASLRFTGTNGTPPPIEEPSIAGEDQEESSSEGSDEDETATEAPAVNTTWDDAKENEARIAASDDDLEFIAPRHTTNYEVCARLVKISDRSTVNTSCATVQQKSQQSIPQGFNPQMQQLGPTRGGSSDAIFRGVR